MSDKYVLSLPINNPFIKHEEKLIFVFIIGLSDICICRLRLFAIRTDFDDAVNPLGMDNQKTVLRLENSCRTKAISPVRLIRYWYLGHGGMNRDEGDVWNSEKVNAKAICIGALSGAKD